MTQRNYVATFRICNKWTLGASYRRNKHNNCLLLQLISYCLRLILQIWAIIQSLHQLKKRDKVFDLCLMILNYSPRSSNLGCNIIGISHKVANVPGVPMQDNRGQLDKKHFDWFTHSRCRISTSLPYTIQFNQVPHFRVIKHSLIRVN